MSLSGQVTLQLHKIGQRVFAPSGELYLKTAARVLSEKLQRVRISRASYERYPFLRDRKRVVQDLVDALEWVASDKGLAVTLSAAKLEAKGYPTDFADALEYGTVYMPKVSWMRPTADRVMTQAVQWAVSEMK